MDSMQQTTLETGIRWRSSEAFKVTGPIIYIPKSIPYTKSWMSQKLKYKSDITIHNPKFRDLVKPSHVYIGIPFCTTIIFSLTHARYMLYALHTNYIVQNSISNRLVPNKMANKPP